MRPTDILKLVEAGFTKAEILKMTQPAESAPSAQPAEPTPTVQPAEPASAEPQETAAMLAIKALTEQVAKQSELFNRMAILNSQQPKEETVSDIMASIINPKQEV